ncbi:double-cubane-cluster-containing anaerobic reductase [Sporohalobacter salinus]|uniref:double-cubane-cluster-containing anaerobic reductase n=1 Tax=Sporohalobacter salinus TaxID=1494606 RepID=UPI0019609DC4|nr:double-cubane-cluster-containing anaerobic reductase [Sporohalobacter salinus]MBM7625043.1 benzoyl-CoA reductase/2-hydroxyglutaryl-CoA dehydratase subunit BcrC/BadD/HgdB [Sporohalobacter salinus]
MSNLDEFFEELRPDELDGYGPIAVKELKKEKNVVGTYCIFTPYELISAAEAIPVTLCSTSDATIKEAEQHLPRNLCPLIKSSYGYALTDKCPYFHFADLVVGETTCDGKKKMYEYLGRMTPVHVMQLPQSNNREEDFENWKEEMIILKNALEEKFNVTITDQRLKEEIKKKNLERETLKEFYQLSQLTPPPLYGTEILQVLDISKFTFDKSLANQRTRNIIEEVKKSYNNGERRISEDAPRILITGCPIGQATEKVVELVEESGGVVVCFENCSGVKGNEELVDENIAPIDALTEKYLNTPCSCMSPNDNRIDLLSELIDEYQVDGVIDMVLQACHTYNVETFRIKSFVTDKKNIPYISLETDYSQSDVGQLKTRISAFVEML